MKAINIVWVILMIVFLLIGIQHGKALGQLEAIEEYEQGFKDGWKEALYGRPVSEELEMVCLGLWFGSLAQKGD